jgi:hypothetical protein
LFENPQALKAVADRTFSDSQNFPVTANALQPRFAGDGGQAPYFNYSDGFVAVIDPVAYKLIYSSYFGGSEDDQFWDLALDGAGGVWANGAENLKHFRFSKNVFGSRNLGRSNCRSLISPALIVHAAL